jgi:hypothetical protein
LAPLALQFGFNYFSLSEIKQSYNYKCLKKIELRWVICTVNYFSLSLVRMGAGPASNSCRSRPDKFGPRSHQYTSAFGSTQHRMQSIQLLFRFRFSNLPPPAEVLPTGTVDFEEKPNSI